MENFKELGNAIGCGGDINNVCNFLATNHYNWMCIFDNADDRNMVLENYIPRCDHGNIIITSRLTEVSQLNSPGCHIKFGDLDKNNAIKLLLNPAHSDISEVNFGLASEIVDALECHALAVSTAGAYIHANRTCTLAKYLTRFKKKRRELLSYRKKGLDQYQRSIYSAFQLSFEQLSHQTQLLLQMCAHFHPTAIPMEIFTRAAAFSGSDIETADISPPTQGIDLMLRFLDLFPEDSTWDDSVDELCKLSLASYEDLGKTLSLHTVIYACAQEATTCEANMSQAAVLILGRAIPRGDTSDEYRFHHHIFLQASHFETSMLPTVYVGDGLARIFLDHGRWETAGRLLEETLLLKKKAIGDQHDPDTLVSMSKLAFTYQQRGKLKAAEKMQEEVCLLMKEERGGYHPDTLSSILNLACTYQQRGKLKAAEMMQEEGLLLIKEIDGEYNPNTLTAMSNLAATYREHGNLEAAEKMQKEVLSLKKAVIGELHPDTLLSMNNLATTYQHSGKFEVAEQMLEEVLLLMKKLNREHHPDTLIAMGNLAFTYTQCGKLEAAEKIQKEVLSLRKAVIGEHHPDTLASMFSLTDTYLKCGKLEAAEKMQKEVLLLMKKLSETHHPSILAAMSDLASTYLKCGKLEAAEKMQEEVLLLMKGEHHHKKLGSMFKLAHIYQQHGKLEAAEKMQEEALPLILMELVSRILRPAIC